jgi:hypothetical protein
MRWKEKEERGGKREGEERRAERRKADQFISHSFTYGCVF